MLECEDESIDPKMIKDLFGFSKKAQISITRPDKVIRDSMRGISFTLT
jgi:hypothetical protein